jgi:ribonuclease BN (tRNA processing enzyme)
MYKKRSTSSLIVKIGNEPMLFDSGNGCIRQLLKTDVHHRDINMIFYTHVHPDHTSDLPALIHGWCYGVPETRKSPLNIVAHPSFKRFFGQMKKTFFPWFGDDFFKLNIFNALNSVNIHNAVITALPMKHDASSVGYRIEEEGKVVALSGDTEYCKNVVRLGKNADLLILECSFPNEMGPAYSGHLWPEMAGRIATEANAKKLLLTHFYPECDQVDIKKQCRTFKGEIILARDLMKVEV